MVGVLKNLTGNFHPICGQCEKGERDVGFI
jgi:hypothetical protein